MPPKKRLSNSPDGLRQAAARFKRMVDANIIGIIIVNAKGEVLEANDYYLRLTGFSRKEFKQGLLNWRGITPKEWAFADEKALDQLRRGPVSRPFEKEYLRRDGRRVPVLLTAANLPGPGNQIATFVLDLTELKRAEGVTREAALFRELVINNLHEGLIVYGPDQRYQVWNRFMETITGLKARNVLGRMPLEVFPFMGEVGQIERLNRALAGETVGPVEFPYRTTKKSGWTSNTSVPLRNPQGQIIGVLAIVQDITQRKRDEEERHKLQEQLNQAQKMESIGRLADGVAHDFNNMLSGILGHTDLLLRDARQGSRLHAGLAEIQKAAQRSADLTRQLLAFARKQAIAPRALDLNETVLSSISMLKRLIGEDVELSFKPGSGLWPVHADETQVGQILTNLCVNSRDAIKGVGKISIETKNVAAAEAEAGHQAIKGDFVALRVRDDGQGMTPEVLSHLYEPFFTTKDVGKGTGLGLATVYGIVTQNQGFIRVESAPGKGACFTIHLPRHRGSGSLLAGADRPAKTRSGGETVLLVEDEPVILQVAEMMLKELGYNVLPARTPGQALALARALRGRVDLLLTDVVMPEMNGRDLAKRLSALYPGMKLLFMSGYTADIISQQGVLEAGVHFLQKPFTLDALSAKLREVLDNGKA